MVQLRRMEKYPFTRRKFKYSIQNTCIKMDEPIQKQIIVCCLHHISIDKCNLQWFKNTPNEHNINYNNEIWQNKESIGIM